MASTSDYRSALYKSYVSGHQGVIPVSSVRALSAHILPRLPPDRNASILDIGCGQGQLVQALTERGYGRVLGIDVSEEQVSLARSRGNPVEHADFMSLPENWQSSFDAITALDVLEHFDPHEVQDAFQALFGLLKPGGALILRTPNAASPFGGRLRYGDLTHGVAYTDRSLRQVAAATGFVTMATYPARPTGETLKQLCRRAAWRLIEATYVLALMIETGERDHIVTQNLIAVATKQAP